jgi:hypothetical protein
MALSTIQKIDRLSVDSDLMHSVVHGGVSDTVPTEGGVIPTMANAVNTLKAYNVRGDWVAGMALAMKDIVISGGVAYVALSPVAFISNDIAADLAAGRVGVHQGATREELAAESGAVLIGFRQPGANTVTRTAQDKMSDGYSLFDAMTVAQRAAARARDLSVDMTDAIQRAINDGNRLIDVPDSAIRIDGTVEGGSDVIFRGAGDFRTSFVITGANTGFVFGGGFGTGTNVLQRIGFRDLCLTMKGSGSAMRFTGCMNVGLKKVRFLGGTGYQLELEQVFDSEFDSVYWASTTGTNAALNIRSGTVDCSNNLRFKGCTWEQLSAGAIRSVTETGGLENYSYTFSDGCKWERCNTSGSANPWILMAPASGTRAHVSIAFDNPIFALDDDVTSLLFKGSTVSQLSFKDMQATAQVAHAGPLMAIDTTVLVKVDGLYTFIPGASATTYVPIANTGVNTGLSVSRVFLNNVVVSQASQALGTTTVHSVQNIQNLPGTFQQFTQPGVGTYSWSMESAGALVVRSSLLSGDIAWQVTPAGRFAARYGITNSDSTWSGNLFRLGAFNLWVDASGRLRIKNGSPTSDTDGAVVGAQS